MPYSESRPHWLGLLSARSSVLFLLARSYLCLASHPLYITSYNRPISAPRAHLGHFTYTLC